MRIKKAIVYFVAAVTLAFSASTVNAAPISKFPYFNDFNDFEDIIVTEDVNNESLTPMDCQFESYGDELMITTDEDFPEHGKVLKHVTKSGAEEKSITYRFPSQSEGIVKISFDIRHHDERKLYLKFSMLVWTPILSMQEGTYTLIDTDKKGSYSSEEWNHVDIVINLDEGSRTISFNGNESVSVFTEPDISYIYFQLQDDGDPNSEKTEIYLDNLSIDAVDSNADVGLYSDNGGEIKDVAGEAKELFLKISDSEIDSLATLTEEDITIKDFGTNRFVVEEKNVRFTLSPEDKGLKLKLNSQLENGHIYKVLLSENARTVLGRGFETSEFEFYVVSEQKVIMKETGEDFSEISELNEVSRGKNIADGSPLKYSSAKSGSKSYTLVSDLECTDGAGLLLKGDRALTLDVEDGLGVRSGKYEIEARYKVLTGTAKLSFSNSSISGIPFLETTAGRHIVYRQNDNAAMGLQYSYENADDEWTVAKYTVNLDDNTLVYDIDGKIGLVKMPYYDTESMENVLSGGVGFIRFEQSEKGSAGEVLLDYIAIRSEKTAPYIAKVTYTDSYGNEDILVEGVKLVPHTEKMTLYFAGNVDEATLDGIKISTDGVDEVFSGELNKDENSYEITFDNYLQSDSVYDITIPQNVTGAEINASIETDKGAYEVLEMVFTDALGNATENIYLADNVRLVLINTLGETENLSMVYYAHSGKSLKNMCFKNIAVTPDTRKVECVMPISRAGEATRMQSFLVNNIKSLMPQGGYVSLGK